MWWSPDGSTIAVNSQSGAGPRYWQEQSSRIIDVASGRVSSLSKKTSLESSNGFSPDGQHYAYTWARNGDTRFVNETWIIPSGGGAARNLTSALDANASSQWAPDGKAMYVMTLKGTNNVLWLQPLAGPARRLDTGRLGLFGFSISNIGSLALVGSEPDRPNELYYKETADAPLQRLTDFNGHIAALELGRQEPLQWKNDGFDVDGIVTYRLDMRPGSDIRSSSSFMADRAARQRAASARSRNGWRRRDGLSSSPITAAATTAATPFRRRSGNDAGAGPGRDVMAGVDVLIKRGIADPAKMAVSGWSYGGYMTAWLLGNYPDRWRAGIAGPAVTDHIDQYAFSDIHSNVATYYGG